MNNDDIKYSNEKLSDLLNTMSSNNKIVISSAYIKPGYDLEQLEEIEDGLGISLNSDLQQFFTKTGEFSLLWTASKSQRIPEQDSGYVTGSIQILNPFDMIMGKTGTRWKDVLWFEDQDQGDIESYKSFVPFDFPTTELISGFKVKEGRLSDEMYLLNINEGISPLNITLNEYLNYLVETKGFMYWQLFFEDRGSAEYERFIKFMPILFPDFKPYLFDKLNGR